MSDHSDGWHDGDEEIFWMLIMFVVAFATGFLLFF